MGNKEKGLQSLRTAETLQREMLAEQPQSLSVRRSLSETLNVAGEWHKRDSQWDEAIESFTEAAALREELVKESSHDAELQRLLANVHMNLGIARQAKGDWQTAVQEQTTAQEMRLKLQKEHANRVEVLRDVGQGAFNLGLLYLAAPQAAPENEEPYVDRAARSLDQAIDVFLQLLAREPSHPQYLYRLLLSYRTRASLTNEADDLYSKAEPVAAKLDAENPQTPKYRIEHGALLLDYGAFLAAGGRREDAVQKLELLDHLLAPLAQAHHEAAEHLAQAHRLWAQILAELNHADQRRLHLQAAIKYYRLLKEQTGDATLSDEITRLDELLAEAQ